MGWEVEWMNALTVTRFPKCISPFKKISKSKSAIFFVSGSLCLWHPNSLMRTLARQICPCVSLYEDSLFFLRNPTQLAAEPTLTFPPFLHHHLHWMAAHTHSRTQLLSFFLGNRLMCLPPCFLKGGGGNTWGPRENEDNSTVKYGCIPTWSFAKYIPIVQQFQHRDSFFNEHPFTTGIL